MPKLVIDRVYAIAVDENMPEYLTFTNSSGYDIGYYGKLMLVVPASGIL